MSRERYVFLLGLALVSGCATSPSLDISPEEKILLGEPRPDFDLVTIRSASAAILRKRAREIPAAYDLRHITPRLARTLKRAGGVGLAGPQVGLSWRVVLVIMDSRSAHPRTIVARNPQIVERSVEVVPSYEGCLSIPEVGGLVLRQKWVRVSYFDEIGQEREIHAENFNAFIWQHEIDHLDGALYTDRLQGELMSLEEMRRRRR